MGSEIWGSGGALCETFVHVPLPSWFRFISKISALTDEAENQYMMGIAHYRLA